MRFAIVAGRQQFEMPERTRDVKLAWPTESITIRMRAPSLRESGGYHLERIPQRKQRLVHRLSSTGKRAGSLTLNEAVRYSPLRPRLRNALSHNSMIEPQCTQVTSPSPRRSGCLSVFLLSLGNRIPEFGY